jgi:hypothetical protein
MTAIKLRTGIEELHLHLVLFVVSFTAVGFVCFWLLGSCYGLIRRPAVLFPPSLAIKMTLIAIVGSVVAGVGGIIGATLIFNYEFGKREDYNVVRSSIAGVTISMLGSVVLFVSFLGLGGQIFG